MNQVLTSNGQAQAGGMKELISFRIGAQEFCVDIMAIREIRGWTPATALPQSPSFVKGVINLRGAVLPIVDMAARMGFDQTEPTERHVIIVTWIHGQLVGLLVDAVCDILPVPPEELQATPDLVGDDAHAFVEALFSTEDRMVGLVRLSAVMPPSELQAA
jgi:purine-binding chemotaxis protein CheW